MILFFVMVAMLMFGGRMCSSVNTDRETRLEEERLRYGYEVLHNLRDDTGYVETSIQDNWEYVC